MNAFPRWQQLAAPGLMAACGIALGLIVHALLPAAPGPGGLGLLFALATGAGTGAAARAQGRRALHPAFAVAADALSLAGQAVVAILVVWLLTGDLAMLLVTLLAMALVRRSWAASGRALLAGVQTDAAAAAVAMRQRVLVCWLAMALGLLFAAALYQHASRWTVPAVLLGGASGLVLLAGTQQQVLRGRRGTTAAPGIDFGAWWTAVGALIALLAVVAAVLPPLPALMAPGHLHGLVVGLERHLPASAAGATPAPPAPRAGLRPAAPRLAASIVAIAVLAGFFALVLGWIVSVLRRLRRLPRVRRLGWWPALREQLLAVGSFLLGLFSALAEVFAGGWLGLLADLRAAWRIAALRRLWARLRRLVRRSRPAPEPAPGAEPRSAAGAAPQAAGGPRDQMRALYRRFLADARAAGLGRRPAETPRAHQRMVAGAAPAAADPLGGLTASYEQARFAAAELTEPQLRDARTQREAVARALAGRRTRGTGR